MADQVSASIVGKVVDSLFGKAKEEISYMCNCTENVENFRNQAEKFRHMKGRVEQRIDIATRNGEDLLVGVQQWMDRAEAQISMADEFLTEEANAKKRCFNIRLCVNLGTLHHYGKKSVTKVDSLLQLQEDGKTFENVVSVPAPPPRLLDVYQEKNIEDLVSHKSVLSEIVRAIEDDNTQIIGIYGLGGVGKTTLATEALAQVKSRFADYIFTTVSQTVNVEKIQQEVGKVTNRILKGEKILIILDDMWEALKLEDLSIPFRKNRKILLTSRSIDVCLSMNAEKSICINPLKEYEAWNLFKRVVGEKVETDYKLKDIAEQVVGECGGLPLIIQVIGSSLKNKQIDIWQAALHRLQRHDQLNISRDIRRAYNHLKLSYDYLESEEAKWCFLLCSMFPEDSSIDLEKLAYYMVGLEKFNNLESMEDARNRVRMAVSTLKSSFLLLNGYKEFETKMHDVVRDVALLIASGEDEIKFLVEAGKGLKKWLPRRNNSLESYTGISLMENHISELPDYEIHFPHLHILLLQENVELSTVSDEFIGGMKEVRVLDLEYTDIPSLPQTLRLLTKLRMLNLGGTRRLGGISILGELNNLEILILDGYAIKEIPQEIGQLVHLRRLEIQNQIKFSHTLTLVISKLHRLEELCIGIEDMHEGIHDFLAEVMKLSELTLLKLRLPCFDVFPQDFDVGKFKRFFIQIGGHIDDEFSFTRSLAVGFKRGGEVPLTMLVKKLFDASTAIYIEGGGNTESILRLQGFFHNLESLWLSDCGNVISLVDKEMIGEGDIKEKFFINLEHLRLDDLRELEAIWRCPDHYIDFCNLMKLGIYGCSNLTRLFSVRVAQGLSNLKYIWIQGCGRLEEVICAAHEESDEDIVFRSLVIISLFKSLNLKSFYSGNATIKYPSLTHVMIRHCESMKRWGGELGIHETPNLKFVNDMPLDLDGPSAINDVVKKIYESY